MNRYIDADKLHPDKLTVGGTLAISQNQIAEQPTADVRENIHGKWIKWEAENGIDIGCECSNCHYKSYASPDYGTNFCPNCGASMLKGEKDGRFN